jgi:hypothetical protein
MSLVPHHSGVPSGVSWRIVLHSGMPIQEAGTSKPRDIIRCRNAVGGEAGCCWTARSAWAPTVRLTFPRTQEG